jgi:rubrerythrin
MSEATERSKQLYKTALEMEAGGRDYYQGAMDTCGNDLCREVFRMLRDAEVEHMEHIDRIYEMLSTSCEWSDDLAVFETAPDWGAVFRELARKQEGRITAQTDQIEALRIGAEMESASIRFYQDLEAQAVDPCEKRFAGHMVAEERGHLNLLTDLKYYYEDPEGWYMEKERAGLDGA